MQCYTSTSLFRKHYDVIIVGGGLVGAALCAALARINEPLKVALIEPNLTAFEQLQQNDSTQKPQLRTSTLNPASQRWLKELRVWQLLDSQEIAPFSRMKIWDSRSGASLVFHSTEIGMDTLGFTVSNDNLIRCFYKRIQKEKKSWQKSIDLHSSRIVSYHWPKPSTSGFSEWPTLTLENEIRLKGRVIIAADGSKSATRTSAKLPWFSYPYGQKAVVLTVRTQVPHRTAWQKFLSTGPVALLPMAGLSLSNIVWSTSETEANLLVSASHAQIIKELNEIFQGIGETESLTNGESEEECPPIISEILNGPASFPLFLGHASDYVQDRLVLIGDAAHTVHPLAGQGVNLGFADARCLSNIIQNALLTGRDIGEYALLLNYQRQRLPRSVAMISALHSLEKIFSLNSSPFAFTRGIGMSLLGAVLPLKKAIIHYASGMEENS
eukprot:jgi/Galph1/174/GphlegSOOS_G4964.1